MKLRNKKTGEIRELPDGFFCGDNLKKICEEWEDYEEPEYYWCIDCVSKNGLGNFRHSDDDVDEFNKSIGNYFETKEEAEKAVEKLKAWKRLESHDLFISKGNRTFVNTDDVFVVQNVQFRIDTYGDVEEDLDLLFGGEE